MGFSIYPSPITHVFRFSGNTYIFLRMSVELTSHCPFSARLKKPSKANLVLALNVGMVLYNGTMMSSATTIIPTNHFHK